MPNQHIYTMQELQNIITPIAKKHGVKRVSVFGSYSRGEATANSDIDLSIDSGEIRTLLHYFAFVYDLEDALGCHVDVVSSNSSDHKFLASIKKDEVRIYEQ